MQWDFPPSRRTEGWSAWKQGPRWQNLLGAFVLSCVGGDGSLCKTKCCAFLPGKRHSHRGLGFILDSEVLPTVEEAHSAGGRSQLKHSPMKNHSWKTDVLLTGDWRGATCALLSNASRHIIVDTGMPHEAYRLIEALEKRQLHPSDIHMVINTHFHIDHVLNNCLFPAAEIYASQQSYDWCCAVYSDLQDEQNWERLILKYYPQTVDYAKAQKLKGALRRTALRWWDRRRLGDP